MEKNQEFISVINSLMLVLDYQSRLLESVHSGEPAEIRHAVVSAAKAAAILNVPVILSSLHDEPGDNFIKELADIFPGKEIIRRNPYFLNALAEPALDTRVKRLHREKLIIAGLLTGERLLETSLAAIEEGYDVYVLIDAAGDTSIERHNYGVQKMLKAGVTPITWMSLASEWMNGWAFSTETFAEETEKNNAMLSYLAKE